MAFRSRGLSQKMNICILPPYDSISSTIFNLNCRLKSCSPKWPHAEFNRGLLSPFYNIQKRIMHQFSLFPASESSWVHTVWPWGFVCPDNTHLWRLPPILHGATMTKHNTYSRYRGFWCQARLMPSL